MTVDVTHHLKDPAKLTPYEEALLDLRKQGLTYSQMAEVLDGKSNARTIGARFKIIREKVEIIEAENALKSA